jgi:transcriptional regulator with XRE-family HTH domain
MSFAHTYKQYKDKMTERFFSNAEKILSDKRKEKGYSLRAEAIRMGIAENDIKITLRNRMTPSIFTAYMIAQVLDCSIEELMQGVYDVNFKKLKIEYEPKRGTKKKIEEENNKS